LDNIKKNNEIVNAISLRIGKVARENAKKQIALLKNDLSRFGYEVKEGSGGFFLVKI
jgi:hypothetical protein